MRGLVLFAVLALFQAAPVLAAEYATTEEAVAMVEKAETLLKKEGKDKALAAIQADPKQFTDRDLYITVTDEAGVRLFHGQNVKLVGKNIGDSVDVNGKEFGKEMLDIAGKSGSGWVDYMFKDPISQKVLPKTSFVKKINDVIVIAGVYKR